MATNRAMNPTSNTTVIESNQRLDGVMADLWQYRELFFFLAWRDLLVRYKQTAIGLAWSVLTPLLTMLVLTIVFGRIAQLPSGGAPYPVMVFAAILPWQFFSSVLTQSSASLVSNRNMVSKVYFPRIIIPTTQVVVSLADLVISLGILACLMLWFGVTPTVRLLLLPPLVGLAILTSLGAGYWISALNVKYRDFRYIVPFMVQFGLYISPVGFSSDVIPASWRFVYSLNPMVGVIDGFRWAILGGDTPLYLNGLLCSIALAVLLFASGAAFFLKTERKFADVI